MCIGTRYTDVMTFEFLQTDNLIQFRLNTIIYTINYIL